MLRLDRREIPQMGQTNNDGITVVFAGPHCRGELDKFFTPLSLLWRWPGEGSDHIAREKLKKAAAAITATAETIYHFEKLYTVNLPKLRSIRAKYDPAKTQKLAGDQNLSAQTRYGHQNVVLFTALEPINEQIVLQASAGRHIGNTGVLAI
ncbi:hypothetical protein BS47DRAFT_1367927 [Hydnum rufescens UP504]|uniref:Uncharacterized protein n=1 Tax=Hydnum rufescens UP504 TaxID=1448309 RepID=A0A9P6AH28_9AGAM|nr:hypothetical protein BS47DRAFT_1367927 [Hydnum rufescens UP504]